MSKKKFCQSKKIIRTSR